MIVIATTEHRQRLFTRCSLKWLLKEKTQINLFFTDNFFNEAFYFYIFCFFCLFNIFCLHKKGGSIVFPDKGIFKRPRMVLFYGRRNRKNFTATKIRNFKLKSMDRNPARKRCKQFFRRKRLYDCKPQRCSLF